MRRYFYFLFFVTLAAHAQEKGFILLNDEKISVPEGTERRLALVIGNKDYERPDAKLKNPINDANDMAVVLEKLGFIVLKYTNLNRIEMLKAINDFGSKLVSYDVGLCYYSGHGMQFGSESYLVPIDAKIQTYSDAEFENVELSRILGKFRDSKIRTSLVFLDACRNNPFPKSTKKGDIIQGLIRPNNPAGSIVVYATREGSTADDNVNAENGLFTQELIRQISTPNISLSDIVINTRNHVLDKSNDIQEPVEYNTLRGQFYFVKTKNNHTGFKSDEQIRGEIDAGKKAFNNQYYDLAFKLLSKNQESYLFDSNIKNILGTIYQNGYGGVEQDYKEALKWFVKAAEQGSIDGQYNLGYMYYNGYGIKQDFKEALKWFLKAAQQNNCISQVYLGYLYFNGFGVEQDYKEALKWFLKSSEQNNQFGQYNLGVHYFNGNGVKQDYKEALNWFLKAAEQNDSDAQYYLGVMYLNGYGVKKEYKESLKWFQKSAEQRHSDSQYNLADMYEHEKGVEKNISMAIRLYQQSAKQGNENAQIALKRLNQTW